MKSLKNQNSNESNLEKKADLQKSALFCNQSDAEIWNAFKNGNESAFIYIYQTYFHNLLNFGLNFVKSREIVKDCIQDVFVEIRQKRAAISHTDKIKPFLFKILRRRIMHYLKKLPKDVTIKPSHEKFKFELSHEQHLINRQFSESQILKLKAAIIKLSTKEREAIFHFYFEDHSYQQIAQIMGYKDVKTARNMVYRAISSLKNMLEPQVFFLFF